MKLTTKNGYEFDELVSLIQKNMRRDLPLLSGFAVCELAEANCLEYVWERILVISAEDVYGIKTTKIWQYRNDFLNTNDKQEKLIHTLKATEEVVCAKKSRDADNVCNFIYLNQVKDFTFDNKYHQACHECQDIDLNQELHTQFSKLDSLPQIVEGHWAEKVLWDNAQTGHYVNIKLPTYSEYPNLKAVAKVFIDEINNKNLINAAFAMHCLISKNHQDFVWNVLYDLSKTDELRTEMLSLYRVGKFILMKKESRLFPSKGLTLIMLQNLHEDLTNEVHVHKTNEIIKFWNDNKDNFIIPDYVLDLHTARGRENNFSRNEFLVRENNVLTPKGVSIIDTATIEKNL